MYVAPPRNSKKRSHVHTVGDKVRHVRGATTQFKKAKLQNSKTAKKERTKELQKGKKRRPRAQSTATK